VFAQAPERPPVQSAPASATISPDAGTPLVIGAGDMLNVAVFDTPSLSFQDRVDEAGFLRTPILGPVPVAGLNTEQASHLFEEKLRSNQIMLNPSVTVQDMEYATQGIVVLGQVRSPGTFTLLGPHNLYDVLSAAGGVTDTGGPSITITHRHDPEHPEVIAVNSPNFSDLQRTTRIYPGDTVFVSKAEVIYVVGDVGHPGAYYIQNGKPLMVLNVLALAQGDNPSAKSTQASIVRTTPQGVSTIPLNIKEIKENKAPDVPLIANDILVVPRSGLKVLLSSIVPGVTLAVTSAVVSAALVH
jgi:polysaccharide export outer membrane protein